MDASLFIILMVALAAANLWIGKKASKSTHTEDDFYLSGRNLKMLPMVLTILATQLGGGTILGAAQEAYVKGWVVLFYPLGTCLGLCLIAMGFGAKLRRMNISTISEIFERVYHSRSLRQISSIFSIVSLFVILIAQGIAARMFFTAIGFSESWVYITFWMILVLYTVMGGITAVVNTDILQVLFIIAAFAITIVFASFDSLQPLPFANVSFEQTDVPWIGWLLMPLLFMFIEQDMAQRFFAAKNAKSVTIGAWVAAGTMLVVTLVPIYFGVTAREYGIVVPPGADVLLTSVAATTNTFVTTIMIAAILMAIISTADTLVCSISSNISYDFSFFHRKNVVWAQGITFVIGIASLICSYMFTSVVSVLIFSYELSVSALFVSVLMGVLGKAPKKSAAWASILCGTAGFFVFKFYPVPFPREILTQALSFGGFGLMSVFGEKKELAAREI